MAENNIKSVVMVASGKGGVGKTCVAVNLAWALANIFGKRVGLLDVDIHGPNVGKMLGLENFKATAAGDKIMPANSQGLRVMSMAFVVEEGVPVIWRGPLKGKAIQQLIEQTLWGELDCLVVDSPPGTGDEPLSVAQQFKDEHAGTIIVTTPQEVALIDARRCINFAREAGLHILGVVENMGPFPCPHCGGIIAPFGEGGGAKIAQELNVPYLGSVPFEAEIVQSSDEGNVYLKDKQNSAAGEALIKIAEEVLAFVEG